MEAVLDAEKGEGNGVGATWRGDNLMCLCAGGVCADRLPQAEEADSLGADPR